MPSTLFNNKPNPINNKFQNIKSMMNIVRGSKNPTAMIQNLIQKNPQIQNLITQNGGDAKTAFYNFAEQHGVNPDDILSMLR